MIKNDSHLIARFGERFKICREQIIRDFPGNEYVLAHSCRFAATVLYLREVIKPKMRILELGFSDVLHRYIDSALECWDYTIFKNRDEEVSLTKGSVMLTNRMLTPATAIAINFEDEIFPNEIDKYDLVICCEVIEHMDVDPMFLMSEISRVTKDNALLFLTTPNAASARIVHKALLGIHPSFFIQYSKVRSPYKHNFEYTVGLLNNLQQASGYEILKIETIDTFEDPSNEGLACLNKLSFPATNRGDNILCISRKIGPIKDRYPAGIYV